MLNFSFILFLFILLASQDVLADSRSCEVQDIENGEFGRYASTVNFEQVNTTEVIEDKESLILRCDKDYAPFPRQNNHSIGGFFEEEITCNDGIWSKYLSCRSNRCGYPPRIKNGYPIIGNKTYRERVHGTVVAYVCRNKMILMGRGKVECYFGEWIGVPPECMRRIISPESPHRTYLRRSGRRKKTKRLSQCTTRWLRKYIGLKLPEEKLLNHSASFEIECNEGYTLSYPVANITCIKGRWAVPKFRCIPDVADENVYAIESSTVRYPKRRWRSRINRRKNRKSNNSGNSSGANETSILP